MNNDLISRSELKKAIIDRYKHWSREYKSLWDTLDGVMCIINNAPTVERPQGKWIPVSERLPGDNEPYEVLCCDIRGEIMIGHPFEDECSECGYSAESECYEMYECIAWQPLPEPYEKEGKEE